MGSCSPRSFFRFCVFLLLAAGATRQAAGEPRRIVLLYPQTAQGSSIGLFDDALRRRIMEQTGGGIEFDRLEIIPSWHSDLEQQQAWHSLMALRYKEEPPAVLVVFGKDLLDGLANAPPEVLDRIPILLADMSSPTSVPKQFVGNLFWIGDEITLRETLDLALRLQPDTERAVVVYGNAPTDISFAEQQLKALETFADRVEIAPLTNLTMDEYGAALSSLPPRTVILYSSILHDSTGTRVSQHLFYKILGERFNAPVYSSWKAALGLGAVGGHMLAMDDYGRAVADAALQVLAGRPLAELEPVARSSMCRNYVDWKVMQRWELPMSNLPPGTVIINQPKAFWQEHRREALTSLILLTLAFLFTGALWQQNRRLLRGKHELRRLAKAVIAREEEKSIYLARELHDDISQRVAGLAMKLARLKQKLAAGDGAGASEVLAALSGDHDRLAHDLHGLARRLHPAIIGDLGLARALEAFIGNFARDNQMDIRFHCDWAGEDISPEVALCLYRVVQQGLDNVRRHARTNQARVFLSRDDKGVKLVIEDEGTGFDPAASDPGRGIGLISMRERVLAQGGTWEIYSAPDAGTSIHAFVPTPGKVAG